MNACDRLHDFLDGRLRDAERDMLAAHVKQCPGCRMKHQAWKHSLDQLQTWASQRTLPGPTEQETARLLAAARPDTRRSQWKPVFGAAALVLAVGVGLLVLMPRRAIDPGARAAIRIVHATSGARVDNDTLLAEDNGHLLVDLDQTRVALTGNSRARLLRASRGDIRLRLERGTLAVEARPGGHRLGIEVGDCFVQVVGTRFRVIRLSSGVRVDVDQGEVQVHSPVGITRVKAGLTLFAGRAASAPEPLTAAARAELRQALIAPGYVRAGGAPQTVDAATTDEPVTEPVNELVEEPAPPPPQEGSPSALRKLATWRSWIVQGHYARAEDALSKYLRRARDDAEAWSTLADCQRKRGRWDPAVRSLDQVIRLGEPNLARRARYRAASLLQDRLGRHQEAARLLRQYLAQASSKDVLLPEARLRLARCLIELGQRDRAGRLLRLVVQHHAGTAAAVRSRQLLDELK